MYRLLEKGANHNVGVVHTIMAQTFLQATCKVQTTKWVQIPYNPLDLQLYSHDSTGIVECSTNILMYRLLEKGANHNVGAHIFKMAQTFIQATCKV